MLDKVPFSDYKIRFIDCDPIGHLTNSRYLDYMLNAREDHVNQAYDLDYTELAMKTGCSWVTLQNQIAYLKEVRYGSQVRINSKLIHYTEKRARVEIQMLDRETLSLHSLLWSEVIFFDLKERRSTTHTPELMEMFQQILVEIPEDNFKTRVENLLVNR